MNKATKTFHRYRELQHIYHELIDSLAAEWAKCPDAGYVSTEIYHLTPGAADYYITCAISPSRGCEKIEVWRDGNRKATESAFLGRVSQILGDWMDKWGVTECRRRVEARPNMSDKDKRLIGEAENTSCFVWFEIEKLIDKAESLEAKEKISNIMKRKYHEEEAAAGLL